MKKEFETARNPIADAPVDPPRVQPADDALHAAVTEALALDGRIAGQDVRVAVTDGCAVLTGTVSHEYLRVLADALAGSVAGILVVKNQLDVTQKGPMGEKPE